MNIFPCLTITIGLALCAAGNASAAVPLRLLRIPANVTAHSGERDRCA